MDASKNPVDVLTELLGDDPRLDPVFISEMRNHLEEDVSLREWNAHYEELINAPDVDCPGCGVGPCQFHREGCPEFERIKAEVEHAE